MKKEKKKQERSKKNILYKNWYETKKPDKWHQKKNEKKSKQRLYDRIDSF